MTRNYKKLYNVRLTIAEIEQIEILIGVRRREGWYCGNKEQYEKREDNINEKLREAKNGSV